MLRHLSRESTRWRVRVCARANAGCSLQAAAGTLEHGDGPREGGVSLAQWVLKRRGPTSISAAQRARAACARAASPLSRELAVARSRVRKRERRLLPEAAAVTSEHGHAPRERAVSLAQWICKRHGPTSTSAAQRTHAACARAASPLEREHAVAHSHVRTRERRLLVEAVAATPEHGRGAKEGGV